MKGDPLREARLSHVYHAYRWQPARVAKVRGIYRIWTDKGQFALKPTRNGASHCKLLDRTLRQLMEQNYPHLLPWVKSQEGEPYYVQEGQAFYATPWFGKEWSREVSITDESLLKSLAEMHRLTETIDASEKANFIAPSLEKMAKKWEEQVERLRSFAKIADEREFPSPFDAAFLPRVDELEQAISFAVKGLKRMADIEKKQALRRVFCHRRVHPHNLVCRQSEWKWIDFEHAGIDVPSHDLAQFIQNFPIGKETDPMASFKARLETYETIFPFSLHEKQFLYICLAYPSNVIRWLKRYYKKQRSRDEMFYVQGLEHALHHFQALKHFIKQTWPRSQPIKKPKTVSR